MPQFRIFHIFGPWPTHLIASPYSIIFLWLPVGERRILRPWPFRWRPWRGWSSHRSLPSTQQCSKAGLWWDLENHRNQWMEKNKHLGGWHQMDYLENNMILCLNCLKFFKNDLMGLSENRICPQELHFYEGTWCLPRGFRGTLFQGNHFSWSGVLEVGSPQVFARSCRHPRLRSWGNENRFSIGREQVTREPICRYIYI